MKTPLKSLFTIVVVFSSTISNISMASSTVRAETIKTTVMTSKADRQLIADIFETVDKRILDRKLFNRAFTSNKVALQEIALKGLARIGGKEIFSLIKPYRTHKSQSIRRLAVLALGQTKINEANQLLWKLLETEESELVRAEIYLALANLTEDNIVSKFLTQKESSINVQKSIYYGLAATLTYNQEIKQNYRLIDFNGLIDQIAKDDEMSAPIAYFLARVPNINQYISPSKMTRLTTRVISLENKRLVARLIGKTVKKRHYANRKILSWLIEQSENEDIRLATEAIRAMNSFLYIPQAKIQLGKLQASNIVLVAQTALQVLADSSLKGNEILSLLKKQLKSKNAGMVVAAMSGLIRRQERDDMTWAVKILQHQSTYVKTNFAKLIFNKDPKGFANVLKVLSKDKDLMVSNQAKRLLDSSLKKNSKNEPVGSQKRPTVSYQEAYAATNKTVILKTNIGEIKIKMSSEAPYSSYNFISLVKNGFYDKSYFMRVIGNFVAQGGDPIGDGEGSSEKNIREELSFVSHTIGSVGMASAGKDTASSQFFINTSDNIHLDRNYTVFGHVIEGLDVAMKLAHGDQVNEAIIE